MAPLGTVSFSRREIYREARNLGASIRAAAMLAIRNGAVSISLSSDDGRREGDKYVVKISAKRV